ncbi:helix-turn-helix domain-containing protein [Amycolatopsis pithecellobii]|nr:helix-turn-helix domain-containing protein [Amycolatopsis pithecellobii]
MQVDNIIEHDERWVVRSGRGVRTTQEWQCVLAATHVGFDIGFPAGNDRGFVGEVVRTRLGPMDLVECRAEPFMGRRGPAVMGDPGEDRIGVQMVLSGVERVKGPHAEPIVVTAGQLDLWDGARRVDLEIVEPFIKRTLVFPRDLVLNVCPRLGEVASVPALGSLPGARFLARYVDAMISELSDMDARMRVTAAEVALELLRSAVEPLLPASKTLRREALRARARRYIRAHLADPALGPEPIARELLASLRTLHAAFEDSGDTVASFIRRTRLARCREDLADPSGGSVTEIAFRWGFSDATHFSQAFKREYGISPRDVRTQGSGRTSERG